MKSSFFIVADRGNLKAFRVEKVPAERPPRLRLVRAMNFAEAHTKIVDMNTDMAGGFPSGGGGNGTGEKHYDIEHNRRSARQLALEISEILREEHVPAWSFAAPAELKNAIIEELSPPEKKTLTEAVASDLVNVDPSQLLGHFTQVRAA